MQNMRNPFQSTLMMTLVFTLVSGGCLKSNPKTNDTERLLVASGFKMRLADTPAKLTRIKGLAQRKILAHRSEGKLLYVYVDAEHCRCVYAGSEEAYRRYQDLALDQQLAAEDRRNAIRDQPKEMDWSEWRFDQSW
jgi:hypothetical protein